MDFYNLVKRRLERNTTKCCPSRRTLNTWVGKQHGSSH